MAMALIFDFLSIDLVGGLSIESGMRPGLVIMGQPGANILPGLQAIVKGVQIDTFILQATPQSFNEHIVHPPTLAVHGDFDAPILQRRGKIKAGELATLIGVKYLWLTMVGKGLFKGFQTKITSMLFDKRQLSTLRLYQSMIATR